MKCRASCCWVLKQSFDTNHSLCYTPRESHTAGKFRTFNGSASFCASWGGDEFWRPEKPASIPLLPRRRGRWGEMQQAGKWIEGLSRGRLALLMMGLFALINLAYATSGLRMEQYPLICYMQVLDTSLLQHRLLESVFYLHMQPPLFNFFLGVGLHLFPKHALLAFQICYWIMGLGLYYAVFAVARRLAVSRPLALVLSTVFLASPSYIVYEHWLFYTFPLALLVTLSGLLFARVLKQPRFWVCSAFFWVVLALCLTRSVFLLIYLVLVTLLLLLLRPANRRAILLAACLPILLLTGLYVKNYVLFRQFSVSTWLGMNLSGMTVQAVPIQLRQQLVAEGKLSQLALISRFSKLEDYPAEYLEMHGFEGIPVLRKLHRDAGGVNYNSLVYLRLSDEYLRDDLYVIRHFPQYYLVGMLNAWLCYFRPGSDYWVIQSSFDKVKTVCTVYDYLCYGKVPYYVIRLGKLPIYYAAYTRPYLYLFLLFGLPMLVIYGWRLARRSTHLDPEQRVLLGYLCANIVFVALVVNSFEVGENHRMRFMTDPLYVVLLGVVLQHSLLPCLRKYWPTSKQSALPEAITENTSVRS